MPRTLILSHSHDVHVAAVEWALRTRGEAPAIWYMDQFPVRQDGSIKIYPDGAVSVGATGAVAPDRQDFSVVWLRRQARPTVHPALHPGDRTIAERESRSFLRNALPLLAPSARWVNAPASHQFSDNKALQLREAVRAGFHIPETLISNDPVEIRAFCDRHHADIIMKPFHPAAWQSEKTTHTFLATRVDPSALENEFAVRAAPAIFQPRLAKEFELRVTMMGQSCFAARISDRHISERQAIDWKEDFSALEVGPFELPEDLYRSCVQLMRRLGIVFGCLDIIRGADGGWTFLEVNEMGAFLWIEEFVPSIPLLAAFADFIMDGSAEFRWSGGSRRPSMAEFRASADYARFESEMNTAALSHQYPVTVAEVA